MAFDTTRFFPAFARAGMLTEVAVTSGTSAGLIIQAGYEQPSQIVLDGMVHSTDYSIEYQTADASLKRGDGVTIDGINFRLKQKPEQTGNGAFSKASLEVVP